MRNNAEKFLNYLHDHGCETTGYFGEKPVKLEDDRIHLYSQAAAFSVWFNEGNDKFDSFISISYESQEGNGEVETMDRMFNNFDEFCDWYSSMSFTWTDDLGADVVKLK